MKKHIPNLITLCNLTFGSIAVIFAVQGQLVAASFFIALGIFFDFFDGLAARLLDVKSELGLQLDSLADVITSGLAPALILVQLINISLRDNWNTSFVQEDYVLESGNMLPLIGLLVAAASAYRLAKFNIDTRQTESFIGLPTPANAILIISIPLILTFQPTEEAFSVLLNPWLLLLFVFISSFLLNAELPLFSLKFKNRRFKSNSVRYIFLLLSLVLLFTFWFLAIPAILFLYVLLSVIFRKKTTT